MSPESNARLFWVPDQLDQEARSAPIDVTYAIQAWFCGPGCHGGA
jgi:hypothetical protein